jgi:hypothetical protein
MASQAAGTTAHTTTPPYWDGVSLFCQCWPWTAILPIFSGFHIIGIICVSHHTWSGNDSCMLRAWYRRRRGSDKVYATLSLHPAGLTPSVYVCLLPGAVSIAFKLRLQMKFTSVEEANIHSSFSLVMSNLSLPVLGTTQWARLFLYHSLQCPYIIHSHYYYFFLMNGFMDEWATVNINAESILCHL